MRLSYVFIEAYWGDDGRCRRNGFMMLLVLLASWKYRQSKGRRHRIEPKRATRGKGRAMHRHSKVVTLIAVGNLYGLSMRDEVLQAM